MPAKARVLASFDFEDGTTPAGFAGVVAACPPRPGSRHCLMASVDYHSPELTVVSISIADAHIRYSDSLTLAFDYWQASDARAGIYVHVWNESRKRNYRIRLVAGVPETWNHLEIPLADLSPRQFANVPLDDPENDGPMRTGDRLMTILIGSGKTGGRPFFVDDVRILEYSPGNVPRSAARDIFAPH